MAFSLLYRHGSGKTPLAHGCEWSKRKCHTKCFVHLAASGTASLNVSLQLPLSVHNFCAMFPLRLFTSASRRCYASFSSFRTEFTEHSIAFETDRRTKTRRKVLGCKNAWTHHCLVRGPRDCAGRFSEETCLYSCSQVSQ